MGHTHDDSVPLHPRTWGWWLLLGIFWCLFAVMSLESARSMGRRLVHVVKRIIPRRFNCIKLNLQLAFPDWDAAQIQSLAIRNLEETGAYILETGYILLRGAKSVIVNSEVRGRDVLDAALKSGRNILLLGAHYTCLDSCGSVMGNDAQVDVVLRHQNSAVANYLILRHRRKIFADIIRRDDRAKLVRTLRDTTRQHIVWLAADQDFGHERSVFVPFLGVEKAATLKVTSRIAKQYAMKVVFIEFSYCDEHRRWVIEYRPLENYPTDDPVADAKTLNEVIGESVRRNPHRYYWVHRRFKSLEGGGLRDY